MEKKVVGVIILSILVLGFCAYVLIDLLKLMPIRPEPKFQVSNLSLSEEKIVKGEQITVEVEVVNVGDAGGSHVIKLEIDGELYDSLTVTLEAGESRTVSFDVVKEEAGIYNLSIGELSSSFEVLEPAEFVVSNLLVSPSEVEPGETVTVTVDVKNVGGVEGTYELELKVDGIVEKIREITLGPGSETTESFTLTRETSRSYSVVVGGLSESFEVLKPAEFVFSNLVVSPSEIELGGSVKISVNVTNTGDVSGKCTVEFKIDGVMEYSQEVNLEGGQTKTVSFNTSKNVKQTYDVSVDALSTSFSVVSLSELLSACMYPAIKIGAYVHQLNFNLFNPSSQTITVTNVEFFDEDGDIIHTISAEDIEEIWETGDVEAEGSFSGSLSFQLPPAEDDVKDWTIKFYCLDAEGSEFTLWVLIIHSPNNAHYQRSRSH